MKTKQSLFGLAIWRRLAYLQAVLKDCKLGILTKADKEWALNEITTIKSIQREWWKLENE